MVDMNMWSLVRFNDKSFGIYPTKKVTKSTDGHCIVNHKGSKYYAEEVSNGTKSHLCLLKNRILLAESQKFKDKETETTNSNLSKDIIDSESNEETEMEYLNSSAVDSTSCISNNLITSDTSDDSCVDPDFKLSDVESSENEDQTCKQTNCSQKLSRSSLSSVTDTSLNISSKCNFNSGVSAPDDDELFVEKSLGKSGCKKANFCFFCNKKQQKISRHLEAKHFNEEEVKRFTVLPKGNPERKKIITEIRKKGNFKFNTDKRFNDGELIVSRRPRMSKNKTSRDFKACANCKAFFSVGTLRAHFSRCTGKTFKHNKVVLLLSKKITNRINQRATEVVRKQLFPHLREDMITRLVRYDELVIIYANKMCEKYRNQRYFEMIRQRIRLIGRFLRTIKSQTSEITDFASGF